MRIIAGALKGRRLKSVPGKATRPTSDKVKEAIFQIMGPFFQDGTCLDLFAGSGSLGIEAISRGIEQAVFIDKHSNAIHTIHENINAMNIKQQTEVLKMDAFRALHVLAKRNACFDLILVDPPYQKFAYEKILNELTKLRMLEDNGIVFCEHGTFEELPQTHGSLEVIKQSNYGGTTGITIYCNKENS